MKWRSEVNPVLSGAVKLTLCEAPTRKTGPDYNYGNSVLFALTSPASHVTTGLRLCLLAYRTGVNFCVFLANRGEREASAKRELRVRGGASRSPRFRLCSPEIRKKFLQAIVLIREDLTCVLVWSSGLVLEHSTSRAPVCRSTN